MTIGTGMPINSNRETTSTMTDSPTAGHIHLGVASSSSSSSSSSPGTDGCDVMTDDSRLA